jgi:hypothetical protein
VRQSGEKILQAGSRSHGSGGFKKRTAFHGASIRFAKRETGEA